MTPDIRHLQPNFPFNGNSNGSINSTAMKAVDRLILRETRILKALGTVVLAHPIGQRTRFSPGRSLDGPLPVQHDLMKLIMSALELVPQGWFSWDFTVLRDGAPIAEIDISSWREKGTLTVDGAQYTVYRDGFLGPFILDLNETQVAVARKSAWARSFTVDHQGKTYTLKAASPLGRTFVVLENEQEIGCIAPVGWLTRKAGVDLPDQLPLPFRIFLLWLTVILWKRESEAASASNG